MEKLRQHIAALPHLTVGGIPYLSYRAVTDAVAAFLFPGPAPDQIEAAAYQRILETADALCRELGYQEVVKLTPPDVPFPALGLYWSTKPAPTPRLDAAPDSIVIHADPGRAEMLQEGFLLDARLSQWGLDEVTRQHFKIPVTASDDVVDLMRRAVASDWPSDYRGIWHDILGMCVAAGRDINPTERLFTVIIRGLGQRRYWRFKARLQADSTGAPFLLICLAEENDREEQVVGSHTLFALGHLVMTPGAAALDVDFAPYLARHAAGDWGALDAFDCRQNDTAVQSGDRLLSAYDVPVGKEETERIWIITEADRSATTILLPHEY